MSVLFVPYQKSFCNMLRNQLLLAVLLLLHSQVTAMDLSRVYGDLVSFGRSTTDDQKQHAEKLHDRVIKRVDEKHAELARSLAQENAAVLELERKFEELKANRSKEIAETKAFHEKRESLLLKELDQEKKARNETLTLLQKLEASEKEQTRKLERVEKILLEILSIAISIQKFTFDAHAALGLKVVLCASVIRVYAPMKSFGVSEFTARTSQYFPGFFFQQTFAVFIYNSIGSSIGFFGIDLALLIAFLHSAGLVYCAYQERVTWRHSKEVEIQGKVQKGIDNAVMIMTEGIKELFTVAECQIIQDRMRKTAASVREDSQNELSRTLGDSSLGWLVFLFLASLVISFLVSNGLGSLFRGVIDSVQGAVKPPLAVSASS